MEMHCVAQITLKVVEYVDLAYACLTPEDSRSGGWALYNVD